MPPFLQRFVSLLDVEDVHLRLNQLTLRWRLLGAQALAQQLARHYTWSLMQELYKVIGSVNLLGDPLRVVQHVGAGVYALISQPAAGLLESAQGGPWSRVLEGLALGTQGLLLHCVYAVSNATAKMSIGLRKALAGLGLEGGDVQGRLRVGRGRWVGDAVMLCVAMCAFVCMVVCMVVYTCTCFYA